VVYRIELKLRGWNPYISCVSRLEIFCIGGWLGNHTCRWCMMRSWLEAVETEVVGKTITLI
jgi:hypothetical protein